MNLKGTKTEANLAAAFSGESQAHNKYSYYASKAKKDGYEQIAALFTETAENEKEHAKIWFSCSMTARAGTFDQPADAADGENYEWTDMYATFAREARERDSTELPISLKLSVKLRRSTRLAIAACWPTLRRASSSPATATKFGSAAIAVISW